ncbi:OmpA family protein [Arsenicitalea aurantiaca]|nr:OmpA family protein [Arsenicitalea aurantiaca]
MRSKRLNGVALAALAIAVPGLAMADPGRLHLIVGGEAYDGPPRFEVEFAGEVVGEGVVDRAIDTASEGRFADATDKSAHVQAFDFEIPEAVFDPEGEVRVRFVNEAFGGEGSERDRNIYISSIAVNGRAVTLSGLVTETEAGPRENDVLGEFLILFDGTAEAVLRAPEGGWPALGGPDLPMPGTPEDAAAIATPTLAEQDVEADASEAAQENVPQPAPEAAADAPPPQASREAPAEPETDVAPAAETPVEPDTVSTTETDAASEPDAAETTPQDEPVAAAVAGTDEPCGLDQTYNVLGFNESSNDLTARLRERLDQIIEDIGEERCTVLVTGYSSAQGNHATNALFAVERAQNVLAYLRAQGMQFRRVSATGGGGTERFGPSPADNRRVVITVLP